MLEQYKHFAEFLSLPSPLETYPKLSVFHSGFAALPGNRRYQTSILHTQLPFNNKSATYGSTRTGQHNSETRQPCTDSNGTY